MRDPGTEGGSSDGRSPIDTPEEDLPVGFNTYRVNQARHALAGAINAIHTAGRRAAERRLEIADDPVLKAPWAKTNQASAFAEAEAVATRTVHAERDRASEAAAAIREELDAARQWIENPGTTAQVAGQRLQRLLDADVPLSEVVRRAIATDDQDGLDWLAYNVRSEAIRAVAARGAPDRATAREVERQGERLYEAIIDARLPRLASEARDYHATRRDLARTEARIEQHSRLAVAEAKGTPTAAHRFRVGLLDDERWTGVLDRAEHDPGWAEPTAVGPVAAAREAAAVGSDG